MNKKQSYEKQGRQAEKRVAQYLRLRGYKIWDQRYKTTEGEIESVGTTVGTTEGEIDGATEGATEGPDDTVGLNEGITDAVGVDVGKRDGLKEGELETL